MYLILSILHVVTCNIADAAWLIPMGPLEFPYLILDGSHPASEIIST